MINIPPSINTIIGQQPYPLLFTIISGSHLYGFPPPDSDYDLRGVHILSVEEVVELETGNETIEASKVHESLKIDLVTHVKKFFLMLLKSLRNKLQEAYESSRLPETPSANAALHNLLVRLRANTN